MTLPATSIMMMRQRGLEAIARDIGKGYELFPFNKNQQLTDEEWLRIEWLRLKLTYVEKRAKVKGVTVNNKGV